MPAFYFFGEAACEERFSDLEKKQADEKGLECFKREIGLQKRPTVIYIESKEIAKQLC